jgi:hypothetical protein
MAESYRLKAHPVRGQRILALARMSTGMSCVDELLKKGDPNDMLKMSVRSIMAIQNHGMAYATTRSLVRRLSKDVYLVELKAQRTAWRMAAFIDDEQSQKVIPVLLDSFKGHGGKTGSIPRKTIKSLEEEARIAGRLVREERANGNL